MKTIGIIAEYNPFHNGHAWQIAEAKKRTEADYAVIAMSGDFVQRGEPAMTDKFTRTKMALAGGADLVLELPVQYACGSAEYFARGAVSLLHRIGVIDTLCFGCENEDARAFHALAEVLAHEPDSFQAYLKEALSNGNSFPKARLEALKNWISKHPDCSLSADTCSSLLSSPNNTLGLEYLIACKRKGISMNVLPIKRTGTDYHALEPNGQFASATAIRKNPELAADYIPKESLSILQHAKSTCDFHCSKDYSALLHYALLMKKDYCDFLDINSDLSDRIRNLLPQYESWNQFVTLLKTKQLTESRIRRCLLHILLGIRSDIFAENRLPGLSYARVLGFRKSAAPLLGKIKKEGQIPLLSKTSDAKRLLTESELVMFELNLRSSAIYHSTDTNRSSYDELRQPMIVF